MPVVITKRRKAFNVIYTIEKENGEAEKKYETFYDYKQAVARKHQIEASTNNKIKVSKNMDFREYLNQYVDAVIYNQSSISKYEAFKSLLNNYISKVIHDVKIRDIDENTAKRIVDDIQELPGAIRRHRQNNEKIGAYSINRCIQFLTEASDFLLAKNLIRENYFLHYKAVAKIERSASPEWNMDSWSKLIANCSDERLFVLLHICFDTGLRINEVTGLTWDNLDHLDEGVIISDKSLRRMYKTNAEVLDPSRIIARYEKKGFNDTNTVVLLLRSEESCVIPLHAPVVELLQKWKEDNKNLVAPNVTIFSMKDQRPYDTRVLNKNFKSLTNKTELQDLTLSKLITFGKKMNSNGVTNNDIYYSFAPLPLDCSENLLPPKYIANFHSGGYLRYSQRKNNAFKAETKHCLPKKDHSDLDALIKLIHNDPAVKEALLHKLTEKENTNGDDNQKK